MFITVNGQEYTVDFSYDRPQGAKGINLTHCIFAKVTRHVGNDVEATVLGMGTASCNPHDTFKKAVGRKISLLRAMRDSGIEREDRLPFWEQYFAQARK